MTLTIEKRRLSEAHAHAMFEAERALRDGAGMVGFGVVELRDGDGRLRAATPFTNMITTAGDQYLAQKAIVGISPAGASAPTAANGMKLGTGTTAAAKSGSGAAIVTYISGSNVAFDASYPQASAVGGDNGWLATHKTTWGAGTATNSAITEAAVVNDQATNSAATAANTYARTVFSAQNKGASDILAITWNWKFLGP